MRNVDRDAPRLLFRRIVNRVKRPIFALAYQGTILGDRRR
ncbi:MAG: hypothetical protein ANABAC_1942 [Anaerolineae bacterium]|nr:MAG: hypothetical protein ANABAC_1942 [Anaerolineae bacterium]